MMVEHRVVSLCRMPHVGLSLSRLIYSLHDAGLLGLVCGGCMMCGVTLEMEMEMAFIALAL